MNAHLSELIEHARVRSFERDELIVRPGDPPDRVTMITTGLAVEELAASDGVTCSVCAYGPGDLIGGLDLLAPMRTHAHVRALTAGDAAVFPLRTLQAQAERSPRFALAIGREAARLARLARFEVAERGLVGVPGRVAARLLAMAATWGSPAVGPSGRATVVDLPLRHQDIADLVGSSRETVSKALSRFAGWSWIATQRRRIVLLDEAALRRFIGREPGEEDAANLA